MADPQFAPIPGMEWVVPGPIGDAAIASLPAQGAQRLAQTMARERLNKVKEDEVRARIDRVQSLTQGDLARQRTELDYLKQRYPLLIEQLEGEIDRADLGWEADNLRADRLTGSQVGVYDARAAQIGAETEHDKAKAALELRYLEQRYPGLLRQMEQTIRSERAESIATVGATDALAHQRMVGAGVTAAEGASGLLGDAQDRLGQSLMDPAKLATEEARAAYLRAQAARLGAGAPGSGPGAVNPLDPYSTAANRWNDDVVALAKQLYGADVLSDVVSGEPMIGIDPVRQQRQLQVIRAAQNLAAVAHAAGRPMSPQQAVDAAVAALQGGGAPGQPGGGLPGAAAPRGADPLGIRQ